MRSRAAPPYHAGCMANAREVEVGHCGAQTAVCGGGIKLMHAQSGWPVKRIDCLYMDMGECGTWSKMGE